MRYDSKELTAKMEKTVTAYQDNLGTIRANQANATVLSRVTFEYWGAPTPLNTMADIRVVDGRTLTVTPYDATTLKDMEKAILASDVGLTPMNDGKMLRLVFPQMTEDRRKEVCKQVQRMGEESKVALRNLRRDANDDVKKKKKDNLMTEDEEKDAEKIIQDLTDKYVKAVDTITSAKEKEVMSI